MTYRFTDIHRKTSGSNIIALYIQNAFFNTFQGKQFQGKYDLKESDLIDIPAMENANVLRWMHHITNTEEGKSKSLSTQLSRLLMQDYADGGLVRTNPEQYAEMFTQTRSGKIILKLIKKLTIVASENTLKDDDEQYGILSSIMRTEAEMTGNVYHDYFTTKIEKHEDWFVKEWVEYGVKYHRCYSVPYKIYGYESDGTVIRNYIYNHLHAWVVEKVSRFTDNVRLEMV